ncbi:MAG: TonB-dependent receptor [Hyphomonadaceae bacterium]|nr:TonB-dependent receptor [Hyphomonadaceae bacterium]
MYGLLASCARSALAQRRCGVVTAAGRGAFLARKGLLLGGCTAAALAWSVQALAQGTLLPPVTVEGRTPKAKKAKKAAVTSAPEVAPQVQAHPAPQAAAAAARDQARSEAVYTTPAAVSTAGGSELGAFGQIDTGDVLRSMPGTYTRESPQNPGLAVNIRGLEGSGRVNMMIDGVRQTFRFTGHEAQGFAYVDPALIAGVDVARGAVSTAGGAGALVGTANLRTLDVDDIIKPGQKAGVLTTLTYGTNGVGWQEMLAAGVTNGKVGIAGAISHREPDNYRNGNGITVPFTTQDLVSGLFKMNFALSSEQTLKLGVQVYDNDFFANSYFQNVRRDTYTLSYAYKPHDNPLIDVALNAYANRVRMENFHDATPTATSPSEPPGTSPLGSAAGRIAADSGRGFDVTNTSRFALGGMRVTAAYGYERFFDDVETSNRLRPSAGGGVNPSGEATIAGTFSQTTFSYGLFDLIAGLRYDTYRVDGTFTAQPKNPLGLPPGPFTLDQSDGRFNPKLTLAAQVLPWLQPYVSYGEAFRAPTINETMLGGSHPGGGAAGFAPNPFLEPEIQKGWEFGANIRQDGLFVSRDKVRFKAVYFDMDVENYVAACIDPVTKFNFFCNKPGTSDVRGVELQGMYDAGGAFLGLAYTRTKTNLPAQQDGLGAHSTLPEHILTATGGLRFLDRKLTVGARVSYTSESDVGANNVFKGSLYGSPTMPGYALVDLFTSYKFDNGFEVGATVSNLFDVDYTPALTTPFTAATGCFGGNAAGCNDAGRGRTVLFTAKAQF